MISAIALLLLGTATAFGQGQTGGQISGTVTDASGAAIPGAKVVITSLQTGVDYNNTTNDSGLYVRPGLPVGDYQIKVTVPNFAEYKSNKITLHVSDQLVINARMGMGRVEEHVEVSDSAVQVQTTQIVQ
ncbi:MAG TPA: carboxypeptidase-like regulatory domain-containing protein, partial [Terriglobales bacterium]